MTLALRRLRLPRVHPLVIAGVVAVAVALAGAWIWVRDSSLVGVKRVTVVGASGPDAQRIRAALTVAARNMTTLNVQIARLRTAVAPYPVVKDLKVTTAFPHGIRIRVIEQLGVAVISAGNQRMTVAGDGTLLRDVAPSTALPTISVPALPGGSRLADPAALQAVEVLAAAPYQLLGHVQAVSNSAAHGVTVRLKNGPVLYFGDRDLLDAKWIAAAGVLADSSSKGASYIDVSDPQRPAAGASGGASSAAPSTSAGSTASAASTAGAGTSSTGTSGLVSAATSTQSTAPAAGATVAGAATGGATSVTSTGAPGG